VGELVLWYGMFAPCGHLLETTSFARGAPIFSIGTIVIRKGPEGVCKRARAQGVDETKI
jgi:hypothetical protein